MKSIFIIQIIFVLLVIKELNSKEIINKKSDRKAEVQPPVQQITELNDPADDDIDDDDGYENNANNLLVDNNSKQPGITSIQLLDDVQSYEDSDEKLDLNEINQEENNCTLRYKNENNIKRKSNYLICSKVPLFCRNVCDKLKRLDFDEKLRKISSFTFGSYQIKQNMDLNFKTSLELIDSNAFNGMIIESDIQLRITFGQSNNDIEDYYDSDDSNESNQINSDDYYDEDSSEEGQASSKVISQQIDYDIQTQSTKSELLVVKSMLKKPKVLTINSNAFNGITIKSGGRLIIRIKNYNKVILNSNSLNGLKQLSSSSFMLNMDNVDLVLFKSKCAKSWQAYTASDYDDEDDDDDDDSSDEDADFNSVKFNERLDPEKWSVLFRINLTNIKEAIFETESFSNLKISNSSTFQIIINKFNDVKLGTGSFAQIQQNKMSNFELSLTGRRLKLSDQAFRSLKQDSKSKFIVYFNINQSNICVKQYTFQDLIQNENSTLRVTFLMNEKSDLIINRESFLNIKQDLNSLVQIYVLRVNNLILESESIKFINQSKSSLFEIWTSKAQSNFTIGPRAFSNIIQNSESSIRIGFTSSPTGHFVQSQFLFNQIIPNPTSQIIYDFTQDTNFNLKFPPRLIPRLLPFKSDETSERNNNKKHKESIEEVAWKIFPNLGRQSRPDRLSLQEYKLDSNDFCKIVDVPFDVLVKLNPNTECSCVVYYLYRIVRLMNDDEGGDLSWLNSAPECYRKKYNIWMKESEPGQANDLNQLEASCKFNELINNCKSEPTVTVDEETISGLSSSICDSSFDYYTNDVKDASVSLLTTKSSKKNNDNDLSSDEDIEDEIEDDDDDDSIDDDDSDEEDDDNDQDDNINKINDTKNKIANKNTNYDEKENDSDAENDDENDADDDDSDEDYIVDDDIKSYDFKNIDVKNKQSDNKLSEPVIENKTTLSSRFASIIYKLFHNSSILGLIIIVITSIILIGIVVFIVVLLKCRHRIKGFSVYYDDEDDDNYDIEDDDNEDDVEVDLKEPSKSKMISSLMSKSNQYNYSMFENKPNEPKNGNNYTVCDMNDPSNKVVLVKCDRSESINSSILDLSTAQLVSNQIDDYSSINSSKISEPPAYSDSPRTNIGINNHLNIKTNPLSQI